MLESGWCPYCQAVTNQQTELAHKELKDAYETICTKCRKLLRWHLVGVKKEKDKG